MALFKSSNPALGRKIFEEQTYTPDDAGTMTINGTVNKIGFLLLFTIASAAITWNLAISGFNIMPLMVVGLIGGFVLALITIFNKTRARYLAPLYCIAEGLFIGGISVFMNNMFPGIAMQAMVLTFGVLVSLLGIYKLGLIKVTENFKLIVASATMGIAVFYVIAMISSLFGFQMPLIHDNGTYGIIFSLVVIGIAAMNLVVDFDFIEEGANTGAPKYMEWYAAFGLMVTLIWLYIEILRLLSKLQRD